MGQAPAPAGVVGIGMGVPQPGMPPMQPQPQPGMISGPPQTQTPIIYGYPGILNLGLISIFSLAFLQLSVALTHAMWCVLRGGHAVRVLCL